MITPEQADTFRETGYLILEDFKPSTELETLKREANAIIDAFDANESRAIFSTNKTSQSDDDYLLSSADSVCCFFEEGAFDAKGELIRDKALSINKIGHAIHDLNPVFDRFSRDPRIAEVVRHLGIQEPQIWQSQYIFKQPRIGGVVNWHQDATFFYTEPLSVKTLWFAVDDATLDNGCLWLAKCGSRTPLRERFYRDGGQLKIEVLNEAPWPSLEDALPLEVNAGTLICFDGLVPHYSAANTSSHARHAYTLHVLDGNASYPSTNWLQRSSEFPVRGF